MYSGLRLHSFNSQGCASQSLIQGPTLLSGCECSLMTAVSLAVDLTTSELSHVPQVTSRLEWVGEELWK